MAKWIKRVFRFRNILVVMTVLSLLALLLSYFSPFIHPKTLSLLPLFGLSYWIILLTNLCLLVIWMLLRSKWVFVILVLLLIGGRLHFRIFSMGSNEKNDGGTELHVMSYNVRLFDLYSSIQSNDRTTKDEIFHYLKERNPEIICFQEYYQQDAPTDFVTTDSIIDLLAIKDYHTRFATKMYGRQNFGIALFSKHPIIEKGFVSFPEQKGSFNYCIYADIVKQEDTFRVYNVHLQSIRLQKDDYALFNENEELVAEQSSNALKLLNKVRQAYPIRASQAELVANHIKESPYPVVLCGDFNDTPLSYSYNQLSNVLTDAFRNTSFGLGSTYAGNIPAGRIDYIFHSASIGSHDFHIQQKTLSDHYAIDCKLFLRK